MKKKDNDGAKQETDKKEETAADVTEQDSGKKAMPETSQLSGRSVSPLMIQVEPEEGEGTGPPTPRVAAGAGGSQRGAGAACLVCCRDLLTKQTFVLVLKITGE